MICSNKIRGSICRLGESEMCQCLISGTTERGWRVLLLSEWVNWGGSHDDWLCFWGYRRVCRLFFHSGHSAGQRGRKATTLWFPIELSVFGCTLRAAAVDRVGTESWMEIAWPAAVWGFLNRVYCLVCLSAEVIIFSGPIVRQWKHIKVNERALEKIRRTYKSDVTVC